jgi:hypothetical protein
MMSRSTLEFPSRGVGASTTSVHSQLRYIRHQLPLVPIALTFYHLAARRGVWLCDATEPLAPNSRGYMYQVLLI